MPTPYAPPPQQPIKAPAPMRGVIGAYAAPDCGLGLAAENLVRKYGMTRQQADEFSYCSHQKALAAIVSGKFKDEIVPVEVRSTIVSNGDGRGDRAKTATKVFDTDEGPRADTSLDALARLKPAFHAHRTVTAGNND